MTKLFCLLLVAVAFFGLAKAEEAEPEVYCPPIPPAPEGFNMSKIMGTWYEVMRDPQPRKIEKCVIQTIMTGEASSIRITTMGQDSENKTASETAYGFIRDFANPHVLSVQFANEMQEVPFTVVDMGPSHILIHSCVEMYGLWKMEEVSLYSRWPKMDLATGIKALGVLEAQLGIPSKAMRLVDQDKCRQQ
ncbi:apolipoprotein D-like [Brevipalpus obovatus]|uniref:apolipoprotein D-like n=1 Tax=Brevipalpus obovatus TaxID=246614 RepID=UPI003D9EF7C5